MVGESRTDANIHRAHNAVMSSSKAASHGVLRSTRWPMRRHFGDWTHGHKNNSSQPSPPLVLTIIILLHFQRSDCIRFIGCCKFVSRLVLDLVSKHFLFGIVRFF